LNRMVSSDALKSKAESEQRKAASPHGVDNPPGLALGFGAHRTPEHGRRFPFIKARLGQAGTKFEIRSTKLETNSNVQKNNDPNRVSHDLSWFFGISVIPSFGFVSVFGFRASNFKRGVIFEIQVVSIFVWNFTLIQGSHICIDANTPSPCPLPQEWGRGLRRGGRSRSILSFDD
jgi:hypothetical protein